MADITKMWIATKMLELMQNNSMEKIRVTEICKAADIERPTFYYHFKDKYDLVAWIIYNEAYDSDVFTIESGAESLKKIKNNSMFCGRPYDDPMMNPVWKCMVEYFVKRYTDIAKLSLGTDALDTQLLYSIRYCCMGAVGMTQKWLMNSDMYTAEESVQMMFNTLPKHLQKIFFSGENAD